MQKFQAQIEQRMALEERMRELHQEQAEAKAENPRLSAEMKELKERIDKLQQTEGSQCPLCGQPLAEKERLVLLDRLQIEGKERGDRYRANQALMNEFDERLNDLNQQMNDLNRVDEQLRSASRQHDQTKDRINQITEMRKQWDEQSAPYLLDLKTQLEKESFLPQEHELLIKIDAESKALGYDPAAHTKLRQVELEGRQFETAFNDLGKARAALVPLKREIENIKLQLDRQNEEVTQLRQAYDNAAAQLAADQALMPDLLAAEQSLMDARESENRLRYEVGGAQQKVAVLDVIRQRRKDLDQEREVLTRRIEQLKLLEKSFGKDGVPSLLIEQAIPEIQDQANYTLARLSNNTMSIQLITQRDYKDANREDKKETLDILISDGSGARDYEMFSGGEAFRVNFAIRLALSRVLAQRAGARLQTLVIDEGFGNQDAQGRQRLIEAINLVKNDFARILIITHLEELKEYFPTRIEVEKTPKGSTIRVI